MWNSIYYGHMVNLKTFEKHYLFWTTIFGFVVAAIDIIFLADPLNLLETKLQLLGAIGIVTFFGMLVVSSFFEEHRHKHDKNNETNSEESTTPKPGGKTATTQTPSTKPDKLKANFVAGRGIMRKAIASTLILIYILILGFSLDAGVYDQPLVANSPVTEDSIKTEDKNNSEDDESKQSKNENQPVPQSLLQNFTVVIVAIITFYFGADIAKEIWGKKDSSPKKDDKGGGKDEQNKALMKILNERLAKGDIDESQLKNLKKTLGV